MKARLAKGGKGLAVQSGDTMRWYQIDRPEDFQPDLIHTYNDKKWALAWTTPGQGDGERSRASTAGRWSGPIRPSSEMGVRAVGFRI